MKTLILSMAAVLGLAGSASAMSLREAFDALCNVPNMEVQDVPATDIKVGSHTVTLNAFEAGTTGDMNEAKIMITGTAVYTILNQIPLVYMINGANNGYSGAFLYAMPNDKGSNDFLAVTIDFYMGYIDLFLTTCDDAAVQAYRQAPVTLQGYDLTITPQPNTGARSFILSHTHDDIKLNAVK